METKQQRNKEVPVRRVYRNKVKGNTKLFKEREIGETKKKKS